MKVLFLAALVAAAHAVDYSVKVTTQTVDYASSGGYFYAAALDYTGKLIDFGLMDNVGRNDFEAGNEDEFKFQSDVDLGEISCLIIRAGNQSEDAWMIDTVSITSSTDPQGFNGKNTDNVWMSGDTSEGSLAMMWCAPPKAAKVNRIERE